MNLDAYTKILQSHEAISNSDIDGLKQVINAYPYFQSARALYLKGLKNTENFKYNQALKTTAAYTTDRSILFDFITSEAFLQNEISKFIKQNALQLNNIEVEAQDISIHKKMIIDEVLEKEIISSKPILDPALFQPIKKEDSAVSTPIIEETLSTKNAEASVVLEDRIQNLSKPFEFHKNETHSFNEWLSLSNPKPIEREETKDPDDEKPKLNQTDKFKLIDQFISKNHKLNPRKETSSHNIAKAQMIQPEALMTETLARIYVEQKNYKKAIQSYKILSLKYPEKSGFFADQINVIKQLQDYNT